jgi:hypothetical protein
VKRSKYFFLSMFMLMLSTQAPNILFACKSTQSQETTEIQPLEMVLFDAILADNLPKVQQLINQGVNVNICDSDGRTPLMIAVKRESRGIIEALIAAGAMCYLCERCGKSMRLCCHTNAPRNRSLNKYGISLCIMCGVCTTMFIEIGLIMAAFELHQHGYC